MHRHMNVRILLLPNAAQALRVLIFRTASTRPPGMQRQGRYVRRWLRRLSFYGSKDKTFGKLTADSGQLLSESADKKSTREKDH